MKTYWWVGETAVAEFDSYPAACLALSREGPVITIKHHGKTLLIKKDDIDVGWDRN